MHAITRWLDRVAVARHGGVRVRIRPEGTATVLGRTPGLASARVLHEVRELASGPGVVDVISADGRLRVTGTGTLADPMFLQRLRNVLVAVWSG